MTGTRPDVAAFVRDAAEGASGCVVLGEVAQAHDGSLGMAHAFIDAIADVGADAVKFQTHIASAESTREEPWRVEISYQNATRYNYWKRMEFDEDQWRGLKKHAEDRGLWFLSSPFSIEALELLERVGVPAWKVASGELTDTPLLERMIDTRLPILLSTGMSTLQEIDAAVGRMRKAAVPHAVLQSTTAYPCPPELVGLNLIPFFRTRYRAPVGLSDHSGTIYPAIAAAALGASIVEVHVTLSRRMFGPDVDSSVTVEELRLLTEGVRSVARMLASPVDKDEAASVTAPMRELFGKSLVARIDLPAGTVLELRHLAFKKPGTGISPALLGEVVGKRLRREVLADELLREADLEEK